MPPVPLEVLLDVAPPVPLVVELLDEAPPAPPVLIEVEEEPPAPRSCWRPQPKAAIAVEKATRRRSNRSTRPAYRACARRCDTLPPDMPAAGEVIDTMVRVLAPYFAAACGTMLQYEVITE
jgi:hypothetical protein